MERLLRNTLIKLRFFLGMVIMLGAFSSLTFAVVTPELEVLKSFGTQEGNPTGKLVQDTNGNLYGTILIGGDYRHGAVYKIDKSGNYSVLYSFDGANGESPQAGVILGNDGNLYGITSINWVATTIFKLNISGAAPVYTALYHTSDKVYIGKIIQASDGNIYGINYLNSFSGVIFKLDLSGAKPGHNLLYSPANLDQPIDIIQGSDGKFYGTSLLYGISSENGLSRIIGGTVFQLDISGATPAYTLLQRFNFGSDFSISSLTKGNDGKLYGGTNPMTSGPATLFEVDTSDVTPVYKQLHAFDRLQSPIGNVIPGMDGKFYGIMDNNGVDNIALFQLDLSGLTPVYAVLLSFDVNINLPNNLTQGSDGKFYGTVYRGTDSTGSVVQIDVSGNSPPYKVLHKFEASEGRIPSGNILQAKDGKFYGTTAEGGKAGFGTVFQFDISGTVPVYRSLYDFGMTSGSGYSVYPYVSTYNLLQSNDGKLYGTTSSGGGNQQGTIFQLELSGTTPIYRDLYSFAVPSNPSGLIQAKNGKLYGTTIAGGWIIQPAGYGGAVFQFDLEQGIFSNIKNFSLLDGGHPAAGVVQGSDGKLYGTSIEPGDGLVFQMDISGLEPAYSILHSFGGSDGAGPTSLIQGSNGKLYGSTYTGGSANKGTLYEVDISGATPVHTILHSFSEADPSYPNARLINGGKGKLYGVSGGTGQGTVFELDISGTTPVYTILHYFDGLTASPNNIIMASDGKLYGTTSLGGQFGGGVIYRINLNPTPVNTPPIATNDSYLMTVPKHNKPAIVAAPGVLKNDKDSEGDKLSVVGATSAKPRVIVLPKGAGKVALYSNGSFIYTPIKKDFYGSRSFTYQVTDGKANSNPATVTLTVRGHH